MISIIKPVWSVLENIVTNCENELFVCSPWISQYGMNRLSLSINRIAGLRNLTIWSCLSDANTDAPGLLNLLEGLTNKGLKISLMDSADLHAKIYMADRKTALVGSCNLSKAGFEDNIELGILISEPPVIEDLLRLIKQNEERLTTVSLDELRYFVEKQRPVLPHLDTAVSRNVTPIWRTRQETPAQLTPPATVNESTPPEGAFDPINLFRHGLEILDQKQAEMSKFNFAELVDKRIKIRTYPSGDDGFFAALRSGSVPFGEFEGKIIGECARVKVGASFTAPNPTGEERMTWWFLPRRFRKKGMIIANFPAADSLLLQGRITYAEVLG